LPSLNNPLWVAQLIKVEVVWNGSDNIGTPGLLQHSHFPFPPIATTPSVPARNLIVAGTQARVLPLPARPSAGYCRSSGFCAGVTQQHVEGCRSRVGSFPVISATAWAHEEHMLRGLTREPSQLLKGVKLFRSLFIGVFASRSRSAWWAAPWRHAFHLLYRRAPIIITSLTRTVLLQRHFDGVMQRGAY